MVHGEFGWEVGICALPSPEVGDACVSVTIRLGNVIGHRGICLLKSLLRHCWEQYLTPSQVPGPLATVSHTLLVYLVSSDAPGTISDLRAAAACELDGEGAQTVRGARRGYRARPRAPERSREPSLSKRGGSHLKKSCHRQFLRILWKILPQCLRQKLPQLRTREWL